MTRRWGWIAVALALVPALVACSKQPTIAREVTDDDLTAMALKATDLPPGFSLTDERLTNNEDFAAAYFNEPEKVRGMLDTWGRAAGLVSSFTAAESADKVRQPTAVSSSIDRFADAGHARDAWGKDTDLLQYAKTQPTAPTQLANPRLGDQSAAERMYVADAAGHDLVVYTVTFRQGPLLADVSTVAPKHRDDKGEHATRLARLLHERVSARMR